MAFDAFIYILHTLQNEITQIVLKYKTMFNRKWVPINIKIENTCAVVMHGNHVKINDVIKKSGKFYGDSDKKIYSMQFHEKISTNMFNLFEIQPSYMLNL